jgi:alpha-methylacyl-CoA racemase
VRYGASVVKVGPPGGDPLARMCPGYYEVLSIGQEVVRLDLKDSQNRASLDDWLETMDLLLTASRPAALGRLGLSWPELCARFPRLCKVAVVGHPPPDEDTPGHDLTYQALRDAVAARDAARPGGRPGGDRADRERRPLPPLRQGTRAGRRVRAGGPLGGGQVFRRATAVGLTAPGGVLGGGFPGYGLYRAREGHVALAALEGHFWERLLRELGVKGERRDLERIFQTRTAEQWEEWATERDLPLAAVRNPEHDEQNEADETVSAS